MTFKLTFNKPASRQFIDGIECTGLEIKIENDCVQFKPVADLGPDAVKFSMRERGGFEVIVSGSNENELLAAFKNDDGPYFMLRRMGEWMVASPYNKLGEPPKFEPHIRVWSKDIVIQDRKEKEIADEPETHYARVRWAYAIIASQTKGPGRPSRKLLRARQIRDEFEAEAS